MTPDVGAEGLSVYDPALYKAGSDYKPTYVLYSRPGQVVIQNIGDEQDK